MTLPRVIIGEGVAVGEALSLRRIAVHGRLCWISRPRDSQAPERSNVEIRKGNLKENSGVMSSTQKVNIYLCAGEPKTALPMANGHLVEPFEGSRGMSAWIGDWDQSQIEAHLNSIK